MINLISYTFLVLNSILFLVTTHCLLKAANKKYKLRLKFTCVVLMAVFLTNVFLLCRL